MSDSSDNDVSSSYSSDGEVLTFYKYTTDSPPSSDQDSDPCPQAEELLPPIPLGTLSEADHAEILKILASSEVTPDVRIFPSAVRDHLTQRHGHIVSRLSELSDRGKSVVIATRSLQTLLADGGQEKTAPKDVLCDVCVFSPTEPVLVLTITTGAGRQDRLTRYNSCVNRQILQHVRDNTKYNFSTVCGVVEDSCCRTHDDFVANVKRLEQDAQIMSLPLALLMTRKKCLDIARSFLQLVPVDEPPQACAKLGIKPEYPSSPATYEAILKRIEQLELAHTVSTEDYQQEMEKRDEKYEKMYDEFQQMKQNYLTDVRLSLLMRPRSSSVSESTTVSGYGSTEVDTDVDIGPRQAAGEDGGGRQHQTAGKDYADLNEPAPGIELSKEDIYTGYTELFKYNRDITLHQACEEGKLDVVKYILTNEIANINCRGKLGRTPVMLAAVNGQVAVFDFLVSKNCDMSAVDDNKENILHVACIGGNDEIVRKILVTGISDIESGGRHGGTPVMFAVIFGHKAVFEFLISQHCNLSAVDDNKDNVLHWACMGGNTDIVRALLDTGKYDIEGKGEHSRTPVMLAAYFGHKGVVQYLVSIGSDLKAVDGQGDNILHVACIGGDVAMVKYILSIDVVSIESRGTFGRTPAMTAAAEGHKAVVDVLISEGSDLKAIDDDGDTILHASCYSSDVAMVKYTLSLDVVSIESRGFRDRTPVITAAAHGKKAVFDFLVSRESDLTTITDDGNTILHMACVGGDVDIAKYILSLDVVSIEKRGEYGRTPAMLAAAQGKKAVFDFLVSNESDLTTITDNGDTILHEACLGGNVDIVKYLMTRGVVDRQVKNKAGRTPVQVAELEGHVAVVSLL